MSTPTDRDNGSHTAQRKNMVDPGAECDEHFGSITPATAIRSSAETKTGPLDLNTTANNDSPAETSGFTNYLVDSANKKLRLYHIRATGPSRFFNPTNVHIHLGLHHNEDINDGNNNSIPVGSGPENDQALVWRARNTRKGRKSVNLPNSAYPIPHASPPMTLNLKHLIKGIVRMCTTLPYWDMAFWSGWSYSVGSILFVLDGAFAWGPIAFPDTEWPGEETYAVPLLFFIGTLLYELGATMAYLEAVNDSSFAGSALKRFLEGHEDTKKEMLDEKIHDFFGHLVPHPGRHRDEEAAADKIEESVDPEAGWLTRDRQPSPGTFEQGSKEPAPRRNGVDFGETEEGQSAEYLAWRWWPTWHRLRTHHIREIGYIACSIQLLGATLYSITGVVILPGILSSLSQWQANVAYWIPQIVASTCFLSAGLLFTLETQEKWYRPKYKDLGWWIGFWAVVGSTGFLLCGALGPATYSSSGAAYQSGLSSTWGSGAYLLSSLLQWYEAVNKHENVQPLDGLTR